LNREKRRYQEAPAREEYLLTDMGRELWPAIYLLSRWGDRHLGSKKGVRRIFVHARCDARLDELARCPACGTVAPPTEVEIRSGPGATHQRTDRVSIALRQPHRLLEPLSA
jgi:hypothetical protein